MDLFVVPTIGFDLLYAFVIVRLGRRELIWINVTANPTAEWVVLSMGDELSAGVGVQISLGSGDWGSGISRHWDRRWSFQVGGRGVWAAARL
jgi:hypothetical protein